MFNITQSLAAVKKNLKLSKIRCAFDIGSFCTRVMVNDQLALNQPSCFLFNYSDQRVLSWGDEAIPMFGREPSGTEVVFPIMQGVVYDQDQFELFLKAIVDTLKQELDWAWLSRAEAAYALPANATELDKDIIKQSLTQTGFNKISLINRASAVMASLHQARSSAAPDASIESQIVVIDLGDETTEVVIGSGGRVNFAQTIPSGGKKITAAISNKLKQEHNLVISEQQALKIKHNFYQSLSGHELTLVQQKAVPNNQTQAAAPFSQENDGAHANSDANRKADHDAAADIMQKNQSHKLNIRGINAADYMIETKTIEVDELKAVIEQELEQLMRHIKQVLSLAKSEQLVAALGNGIILTGGGSKLWDIDDYFSMQLQANTVKSKQPFLDVVQGVSLKTAADK